MFRFTIRDMLWLTVVVAVIVGWWLEHRRKMEQEKDAEFFQAATDKWTQLQNPSDSYPAPLPGMRSTDNRP